MHFVCMYRYIQDLFLYFSVHQVVDTRCSTNLTMWLVFCTIDIAMHIHATHIHIHTHTSTHTDTHTQTHTQTHTHTHTQTHTQTHTHTPVDEIHLQIIVQNDFDVHTSCNSRSGEDIVELVNHSHGVHNVDLSEVSTLHSKFYCYPYECIECTSYIR